MFKDLLYLDFLFDFYFFFDKSFIIDFYFFYDNLNLEDILLRSFLFFEEKEEVIIKKEEEGDTDFPFESFMELIIRGYKEKPKIIIEEDEFFSHYTFFLY